MDYPVNILLEDMTYSTEYEFLEVGKNDSELQSVGEKFGLKLPCRDLAIFKGRYAVTDKVNRNGCNLPREEVEKALATLRGKAVDFDHLRKRVVGFWIDAQLRGDQIISYGAFYKGNFPEDYETIKQLMTEGNLKISFEAWGDRHHIEGSSSYNLTDIEFAGGALLLKEKPAEPTAEVLELAKILTAPSTLIHGADEKEYVLDYVENDNWSDISDDMWEEGQKKVDVTANFIRLRQRNPGEFQSGSFRTIDISKSRGIKAVIGRLKGKTTTTVQSFLFVKDKWTVAEAQKWVKEHRASMEKEVEIARLHMHDMEMIMSLLHNLQDSKGNKIMVTDVLRIDFEISKVWIKGVVMKDDGPETDGDGRLVEKTYEVSLTPRSKVVEGSRKVLKVDEVTDGDSSRKVKDTSKPLGDKANGAKGKIENKEAKTDTEVSHTMDEKQKAEFEKLGAEVAELKKQVEERDGQVKTKDGEIAKLTEKVEGYEKAAREAKIKERRETLGDSAKDMKDEELLDDTAYTLAQKDKKIAELEASVKKGKETASLRTGQDGLEAGATDKDEEDPIVKKGKRINQLAFPSEKK